MKKTDPSGRAWEAPPKEQEVPSWVCSHSADTAHPQGFPIARSTRREDSPIPPIPSQGSARGNATNVMGKRSKQFCLSVINFSPSALQIDYVHYLFERRLEPSSLNTSLCHEWLSLKKDFTVLNVRRPEQKCVWAAYRTSHSLSQPTLTPSTYRWCFIVLSIYLTQHWTLVNHINIFLKRIKTPKYLWHSCNQSLKTIQQMYIHFPWYV